MSRKMCNNYSRSGQPSRAETAWASRVDSSNVSGRANQGLRSFSQIGSIIEPCTHKKPILVSNHCVFPYRKARRRHTVIPKYSCRECYCKKSPTRPKLQKSSNEGSELPYDTKMDLLREMCHKGTHLCRGSRGTCKCGCHSHGKDMKGICFCSWCPRCVTCMRGCSCCSPELCHKKSDHYAPCRQYAAPMKAFEKFDTAEKLEQEYQKTFSSKKSEEDDYPDFDSCKVLSSRSKAPKVPTVRDEGPQQFTFFKSATNLRTNLQNVSTFRQENYFDCFSTDVYDGLNDQNHKCVHKFYLDDRLIPRPLNPDPFGISRCLICNKSMQSDASVNKKNSTDARKERKNMKAPSLNNMDNVNLRKMPNQINICGKNEKIEIKVPLTLNKFNDLFVSSANSFPNKNRAPKNSLALRHQRAAM